MKILFCFSANPNRHLDLQVIFMLFVSLDMFSTFVFLVLLELL